MRQDIWFSLTRNQRLKLSSMITYGLLHKIDMTKFKSITANRRIINMMIELKRSYIRGL